MKAIRYHEFGGPDVLQLDEIAKPEPGPNEVLVKVAAIGVNFSEIGRRAGKFPLMPGQSLPMTPGYECAGVVEHVGSGVPPTSFKPGDRVLARAIANTYAEYVAAPAASLYQIPPTLSFNDAATLSGAFTTAWAAVVLAGKVQKGETVLVQAAASGVAIAVVQLAKHAGATVIGTASSDEKLAWAKQYGLDHGINYVTHDFMAEAKGLTGGKGVDVIIDGVGGDVFLKGLKTLRVGGRMVVYGVAGGKRTAEVTLPELWFNSLTIVGASSGTTSREAFQQMIHMVADGRLKATVDRAWPLARAAEAHRYIEDRKVRGKVVLTP
ncbi:MAG: zinc-binding dehydrogenase [SAR202 cluster bacterium]|nr:zinc-binding dehydrogenase [SAR202 cluster bacterium]